MRSDLIIDIELREVSNFKFVWSYENSVFFIGVEILDSLHTACSISVGLVKFNPDEVAWAFVYDLSDIGNFSSCSIF